MDHVMEEILDKFMHMLIKMVSQKKPVKLMQLKILITFPAQIYKDVKIVHLQLDKNQVIKVIVGLNQNTQFGKLINMEELQELKK